MEEEKRRDTLTDFENLELEDKETPEDMTQSQSKGY